VIKLPAHVLADLSDPRSISYVVGPPVTRRSGVWRF